MASGPGSDRPDGGPMARPFASAWRRAHLTDEERVAHGKAARRETPRSTHGRWERPADRPDPIALLEEQAVSRVGELSLSGMGGCWFRRSRSTGAPR